MKKAVKHLTLAYLIFLALMVLSSGLSGFWGEVAYTLSFLIPIIVIFLLNKEILEQPCEYLLPKRDSLIMLGALGAPTVIGVMAVSFATNALIVALSGQTNEIPTDIPFAAALISSALLPAISEELLFRYLPMKLLLPRSGRVCILLSAVMFAFAHRSAFSIPYAILGGILFMLIDIGSGSVIPSVVLHFLNNFLSLTFSYWGDIPTVKICLIVILSLLLCGSLAIFVAFRKRIIPKITEAFSAGEPYGSDSIPLLFIIPCAAFAVLEFIL